MDMRARDVVLREEKFAPRAVGLWMPLQLPQRHLEYRQFLSVVTPSNGEHSVIVVLVCVLLATWSESHAIDDDRVRA